jgi:ABC-type transport system involved in multi-copper enzyme maturation permease subunit
VNGIVVAETLRRNLNSIPYICYVALLAIIAFGISNFDRPAAVWPALISLLAYIIGCAPIGPEFSSGTLQLILTKPVNRSVYLLSRVAGVVIALWVATLIGFAVELTGRAVQGGNLQFNLMGAALVHSLASTILICSLLVFFGSFTRAYFNIAIYVVLMVGVNVLQGLLGFIRQTGTIAGEWLRSHTILDVTLATIEKNLFPDRPVLFDWHWVLMVLSNAAIALVIACFIFRKREVPYGAD